MRINNNSYNELKNSIMASIRGLAIVKDEESMKKPYVDSYTTKEQRARDKKVTKLLGLYVYGYKKKIKSNIKYKEKIFDLCWWTLVGFSISFPLLVGVMIWNKKALSISGLCQLISVCVTYITLIIGILTIIVKYVFPENEEKYITDIVKLIQENDLKNKIENIKVKSKGDEKEENIENSNNEEIEEDE